jgi:hypothetical protein
MLTRNSIKSAQKEGLIWFNTNLNLINNCTRDVIRNNKFTVDKEHFATLLYNIEFLYNEENYWAETDGTTIWLNTYKNWTSPILYYTLIHECIHGLVIRGDGNYLSEYKEHILMGKIDPLLI